MSLDVVTVDEAFSVRIRTANLHIACCTEDTFYCGAPFHPETEATEEHSEDDCCPTCVDVRYAVLCPPGRPTHQHCPLAPHQRCPQS